MLRVLRHHRAPRAGVPGARCRRACLVGVLFPRLLPVRRRRNHHGNAWKARRNGCTTDRWHPKLKRAQLGSFAPYESIRDFPNTCPTVAADDAYCNRAGKNLGRGDLHRCDLGDWVGSLACRKTSTVYTHARTWHRVVGRERETAGFYDHGGRARLRAGRKDVGTDRCAQAGGAAGAGAQCALLCAPDGAEGRVGRHRAGGGQSRVQGSRGQEAHGRSGRRAPSAEVSARSVAARYRRLCRPTPPRS